MIFCGVSLLRRCAVLLGFVCCLPAAAWAACTHDDADWLWQYEGTIGETLRVRMNLVFRDGQVEGTYFYASQLRDIPLRGRIVQGTGLELDELDAAGRVAAHFEARFSDTDPRGRFSGSGLECEIILGTWQQAGASRRLPVFLAQEGGHAGTLAHQYRDNGVADDEAIHRSVQGFRAAVKRGDRQAVAAALAYPIRLQWGGKQHMLRTPADLLAHYEAIFTPAYRDAIVQALPRNLFSRDQGIMLGRGEVWFDGKGRVIALNTP